MPQPYNHSNYTACLPPHWQARASAKPQATWWPWRDMTLHIARAPNPEAPVRMLILHGGGGHSGALWPAAALAADIGYDVLAPDLPGYGQTRVPDPAAVRYSDWVDCVADLLRAETAADPRPLIVVGASMGGLLGYSAIARAGAPSVTHLVATCLLNPADPVTWPALSRWGGATSLRLLRPLMRRLGPRLRRLRVPLRWLVPMTRIANHPHLSRLCSTDARGGGGRVALGFLSSFLFSQPEVAPEAFHAVPVTLIHPGDDHWTPAGMSLPFFDRIAAEKEYVVLARAGHFPVEEPGITQMYDTLQRLYQRYTAATL
ncbi:alpha/beta hydrolase [Alcanivorax sp. JB21]|uniref:alpha/beta hydrolase n=1 Tax=Alcanivorax limicola TaxID=2874102 RepID=UPI001CBF040F|nr:alpha/beta hydrolase [Alcanivorax limicola]MBZ2188481.1 alpha/beta hydrolase [Alcanivorax limicola]